MQNDNNTKKKLPQLINLSENVPVAKTLDETHHDEAGTYMLTKKPFSLISHIAEAPVEKPKASQFSRRCCLAPSKSSLLHALHFFPQTYDLGKYLIIAQLLHTMIKHTLKMYV